MSSKVLWPRIQWWVDINRDHPQPKRYLRVSFFSSQAGFSMLVKHSMSIHANIFSSSTCIYLNAFLRKLVEKQKLQNFTKSATKKRTQVTEVLMVDRQLVSPLGHFGPCVQLRFLEHRDSWRCWIHVFLSNKSWDPTFCFWFWGLIILSRNKQNIQQKTTYKWHIGGFDWHLIHLQIVPKGESLGLQSWNDWTPDSEVAGLVRLAQQAFIQPDAGRFVAGRGLEAASTGWRDHQKCPKKMDETLEGWMSKFNFSFCKRISWFTLGAIVTFLQLCICDCCLFDPYKIIFAD